MSDREAASPAHPRRIFISYSRPDRSRVDGLAQLLEALGHQVFQDHRTISPGARWEASLQDGLDRADVLMVFWTRHAARSDWVRREIDHFLVRDESRPLVPVRGDETPLSERLAARQQSDFSPLVNELLELQRQMQSHGAKPRQVQAAILERLREAGIELDRAQHRRLLQLFVPGGLIGLSIAPLALLARLWGSGVEAAAQLSLVQAALVGAAAVAGAGLCALGHGLAIPPTPPAALVEGAETAAAERGSPYGPTRVPSLGGQTEAHARAELARSGLAVGRVDSERTGEARPGTVVAQNPPPGEEVLAGSPVDLVVARGDHSARGDRPLDLVFVIDVTGSMGQQIEVVKDGILEFAENLAARGVDTRYAGYSFTDRVPFEDHLPFAGAGTDGAADLERFRAWLGGLRLLEGGDTPENSLDAVEHAFGLAYEPTAQVAVVVVSDAPPHQGGVTAASPTRRTVAEVAGRRPARVQLLYASPSAEYRPLGVDLGWPLSAEVMAERLIPVLMGVTLAGDRGRESYDAWEGALAPRLRQDGYRFRYEDWLLMNEVAATGEARDPFSALIAEPATADPAVPGRFFRRYGADGRRRLQRLLALRYRPVVRKFPWWKPSGFEIDPAAGTVAFESAAGLDRGMRRLFARLGLQGSRERTFDELFAQRYERLRQTEPGFGLARWRESPERYPELSLERIAREDDEFRFYRALAELDGIGALREAEAQGWSVAARSHLVADWSLDERNKIVYLDGDDLIAGDPADLAEALRATRRYFGEGRTLHEYLACYRDEPRGALYFELLLSGPYRFFPSDRSFFWTGALTASRVDRGAKEIRIDAFLQPRIAAHRLHGALDRIYGPALRGSAADSEPPSSSVADLTDPIVDRLATSFGAPFGPDWDRSAAAARVAAIRRTLDQLERWPGASLAAAQDRGSLEALQTLAQDPNAVVAVPRRSGDGNDEVEGVTRLLAAAGAEAVSALRAAGQPLSIWAQAFVSLPGGSSGRRYLDHRAVRAELISRLQVRLRQDPPPWAVERFAIDEPLAGVPGRPDFALRLADSDAYAIWELTTSVTPGKAERWLPRDEPQRVRYVTELLYRPDR